MNFISKPNSYNPEINKSDESEPFQRLSKRSRPTCADINLLVRLFRSEIKKLSVSGPF